MVQFTHILCPADLSELSVRPLTYAATLAQWYKAPLTVLHVVPTFDPVSIRSAALDGAVQFVYPTSREEILEARRRLVDGAGAGSVEVRLAADAGDPSRTIVDRALTIPADLLVTGTHGRWVRTLHDWLGRGEGATEGPLQSPPAYAAWEPPLTFFEDGRGLH